MSPSDQARFDSLYQQHVNVLKLRGKAPNTVDAILVLFDVSPLSLIAALTNSIKDKRR